MRIRPNQWLEPTAARRVNSLPVTKAYTRVWSSATVAVAQPKLVRPMRVLVALLLLVPLTLFANTYAMPNLTKERLEGLWQAPVEDNSMATGVYLMLVSAKGEAKLIQLFSNGNSMFFGRATSCDLADGQIKIRFTMDPEHVQYYDWIEIQGSAAGEGDAGAIVGKLIKHRTNTVLDEWSEPVTFKKGRWLQNFATASKEAEKILRDGHIENGHAVPKNP